MTEITRTSSAPFSIIETLRFERGECILLSFHLDRLQTSAAALGFSFTRDKLASDLKRAAWTMLPEVPTRLRVLLEQDGSWSFTGIEPVRPEPDPLCVLLWHEPICSTDPGLRHKTTRVSPYDHAIREARYRDFTDVIFQNEHGHLTEGALNSLVLRHGDRWRTPPLDAGILPGVYRAWLLSTTPALSEENIPVADLFTADEVWLSSAVRGLRQVAVHPSRP